MDPQAIQPPPPTTPTPPTSFTPGLPGPITLISLILAILFASSTAILAYQNIQLRQQLARTTQSALTFPTPPITQTTPTPTTSQQTTIGIQTDICCGCPTRVNSSQIGKDGWELYEQGENYSSMLPAACKNVFCKPCQSLYPTPSLSPPPPSSQIPANTYTCPPSGWVDCMPTIGEQKNDCSKEAMAWYKANCPNFQGGAY